MAGVGLDDGEEERLKATITALDDFDQRHGSFADQYLDAL